MESLWPPLEAVSRTSRWGQDRLYIVTRRGWHPPGEDEVRDVSVSSGVTHWTCIIRGRHAANGTEWSHNRKDGIIPSGVGRGHLRSGGGVVVPPVECIFARNRTNEALQRWSDDRAS